MSVFWIPGEDARQQYMAEALKQRGNCVYTKEDVRLMEVARILLPIPQTAEYMERIGDKLQPGHVVFGCGFQEEEMQKCREKRITLVDYMQSPGVAIQNAVATAEGAIAEAISMGPMTLQGSLSLVVGYGRCGQVLCHKLMALGSHVITVEQKKERLALARAYGVEAWSQLPERERLCSAAYLFNTVPQLLITECVLKKCSPDITIIDIASGAGGVDYCYCKKERLNAKHCLGLPGIYAPKTSADILMEVVLEYKAFP